MPVNASIDDGMRMPGCTSVLHSSTTSPSLEQHDADLDDAVLRRHAARGLEVDAGDRARAATRACSATAAAVSGIAVQPGARPSSDRIGQ